MDKITASHLNFYYGSTKALKDVNLSIAEHKVTAFIGPSVSNMAGHGGPAICTQPSALQPSGRPELETHRNFRLDTLSLRICMP